MRVLLTSTDNPYITQLGGKHIHLLLLEQGLKEIGVQVTTLYYNPKKWSEFIRRCTLILLRGKYGYTHKLKWMITYLRNHIPKEEFDVIHAHDVLSILAISSMPQKKVLTLHGYFARENIEFIKNEKDRETIYPHLLQLEKNGVEHADYVITVDQRLTKYVVSEFGYREDRITLIHNAVDTDRFAPISEKQQQEFKKSTGFSADNLVVLVPRRLVEKNGVIYAVRAMAYLKNDNIRMIIAGDGPERDKIAEEAKNDSRIHFAGTIPHDQIDQYYRMTDIILIPSITSHGVQEASSLAMLEGMACGKVVICSEIGGMREIIQSGKNGILTKEKEPAEIARAVETVMENRSLMAEIGKNARKCAAKNHSFVAHAKKVFNIYKNILGKGET
jgi:glycosyltransferase involved in cell wall biosynthesis